MVGLDVLVTRDLKVSERNGGLDKFEPVSRLEHYVPLTLSLGGGVRLASRVLDFRLKVLLATNLAGKDNRLFGLGLALDFIIHPAKQRRFDPFIYVGSAVLPVAVLNGVNGLGIRAEVGGGMAFKLTRHLFLSARVGYCILEMMTFTERSGETWLGTPKHKGYEVEAPGVRMGMFLIYHPGT